MFAAAGILDIPIDGQQTVAYLVRRTQAFDLEHNAKTSLGFVFNKACDKLCHMKTVRNEDVVEARKQLGLPSLVVKSPGITEYDLKHTDKEELKMLRNDRVHDIRMDSIHTRDLCRTVERHHKNNPHVSMEATFAYVMSNSSAFRALPAACIEKARRYLALPNPEDDAQVKSKPISPKNLETIFTDLNEALQELADSGQPLFLCGLPGSDGVSQVLCEYHVPPIVEPTEVPLYSKFPVDDPQDEPIGITEHDLKHKDEMFIHPATTITPIPNSGDDFPLFLITVDQPTKSSLPGSPDTSSLGVIKTPAKPKPGTTVVHAERVVVNNKKMIKILKFENVTYMKDLPDGYLSEAPTFYKCDPPRNIKANVMFHEQIDSSNTLSYSISHGNTISIKEFGKMIKTMKEAGVRLSKINKTVKLEKEHSGKFTVSI